MGVFRISTRKFMSSQPSAGAKDWELLIWYTQHHGCIWLLLGVKRGKATTKSNFTS